MVMVRMLGDLGVGEEAVVDRAAAALLPVTRQRLLHHGIMPGVRVTVLQRTSGGGRVVALGRTRVALDPDVVAGVVLRDGALP